MERRKHVNLCRKLAKGAHRCSRNHTGKCTILVVLGVGIEVSIEGVPSKKQAIFSRSKSGCCLAAAMLNAVREVKV